MATTNRAVKTSCKNTKVRTAAGACAPERKPMMKSGGTTFGILSIIAGVDKNPKATAADRIAGAKKMKAKGATKALPKAQDGGAYVAWKKGSLTRNHYGFGPTESMDTTGYSKGKKEFDLNRSTYKAGKGTTTTTTKVARKDVPTKIAEFKKGADRTVIESKKKANKFTITEHPKPKIVKKPFSQTGSNGDHRKYGGATHPGFKSVQSSIAAKQGISKEAAGAILASSARKASAKAKAANPRLKRVK